ncbi:MAG: hypothetical protein IIW31_07125 [Clostridia bacterium]|nr:hypothetical protein [Clostridia bacterium]
MKVCVIQPYYSTNHTDTESCYRSMIELMDQCESDLDLIVLPEYCDVPAAQPDKAHFHASIEERNEDILRRACEMAKRCHAMVFVNAADRTETGPRNTTYAIDREGKIAGKYYKAHPAPSEVKTEAQGGNELDVSYSYEFRTPDVIEMEGIRFGFMTCYDFYFYESFAPLALQNVDVIIGCSHQRTDTHQALNIINRFLCYQTNAYLLRASVSLGEDSPICGCSCVIAPDGTVLADLKSRVGRAVCEIDPKEKYYKPAGFRGALKAHYQYIEDGRRPWLYRNGGASVVPFDRYMPYPRLCAHRGMHRIAPENSLPAYGAAVALGAKEIEFDLWVTTDGEIVSSHDSSLDRVSDGTGKIYDHSYAELKTLDFGSKFSENYKGLPIVLFEDILRKFAGHTVMNIHVKTRNNQCEYSEDALRKIVSLIDRYDCRKHIYFMCGNDNFLRLCRRLYPDIRLCCGGGSAPWEIVERAIDIGCEKVQLFKPYFNQEMIDKAHAHGIRCNVFWSNDVEEAKKFLDMGIDTILTDDYFTLSRELGLN